jgi:hypothetical protein
MLLLSLITAAFAQEYDIRTAHRLKTELWSIFESAGIQPANISSNLTEDQIKTLESIRKVNDYPVYIMTYYGDYGFDEFLKVGHSAEAGGPEISEGCSSFGALNPKGNTIYGRNLDLARLYPILVLYTDPPDGYASVSLNIGIDIELYLSDPTEEHTQWVLEYPYWTFDGMNEYGVAVSGLNVEGETVYDPDKASLSRYEMRRLVLDHASTVDEAVGLIRRYNCTSSSTVHFLVSDAQGDSAIVEYYGGKVNVQSNVEPWQATTNFMHRGRAPDAVLGECVRYAAMYTTLESYSGLISRWTGMEILASVSRYMLPVGDDVYVYTVWSGIYDLTGGLLEVYPGTEYNNQETFKLDMINDLTVMKTRVKPLSLTPGDEFRAAVKVKNLSPRPSRKTDVRFYLSKTKKIKDDATYLGRQKLGALKANKTKTLRLRDTLHAPVEPGSYYLVAVVDPKGRNNDPRTRNNLGVSTKKVVIR